MLDYYELRARAMPALLIAAPVVGALLGYLDGLSEGWLKALTGAGAWMIVAYPLSFVVRHLGTRTENQMWAARDGRPTTRVARWRDDTWDADLKAQLHAATRALCGVPLLDAEGELADPAAADRQIEAAFRVVRATLRQCDPGGLWHAHNAEYGFARNLLGSRWLWLALAGAGCMAASAPLWYSQSTIPLDRLGLLLAALSLAMALALGWLVLPRSVKRCAERYAESSWMALVALYRQHARPAAG